MAKSEPKKRTPGPAAAAADSSPFPGMPDAAKAMGLPPSAGPGQPSFAIPMPPGAGMPPPFWVPPGPGLPPPGAGPMPGDTAGGAEFMHSLGSLLRLGIDALNMALAGGNQFLQGLSGVGYHPAAWPGAAPHGSCPGHHGHGHHCCGGHDHHNTYHDSHCHSCCDVCGESCCNPGVHNCC